MSEPNEDPSIEDPVVEKLVLDYGRRESRADHKVQGLVATLTGVLLLAIALVLVFLLMYSLFETELWSDIMAGPHPIFDTVCLLGIFGVLTLVSARLSMRSFASGIRHFRR